MTRSIKGPQRAAALLFGVATATTLLVSGCGAGQIAETANRYPNINGVNAQNADNTFKVRDLAVGYLNIEGYPAGGDAPLEMTLYNDSGQVLTVRVSTTSARSVTLAGESPAPAETATSTGAPSATPGAGTPGGHGATPGGHGASHGAPSATPGGHDASHGAPSATPGGEATSAAPTPVPPPVAGPASIQIPPRGFVILNRSTGSHLRLVGLNEALAPGGSVQLIFEVDGERLEVTAPVAVPLTPVSPAPPVSGEVEGGHGG